MQMTSMMLINFLRSHYMIRELARSITSNARFFSVDAGQDSAFAARRLISAWRTTMNSHSGRLKRKHATLLVLSITFSIHCRDSSSVLMVNLVSCR